MSEPQRIELDLTGRSREERLCAALREANRRILDVEAERDVAVAALQKASRDAEGLLDVLAAAKVDVPWDVREFLYRLSDERYDGTDRRLRYLHRGGGIFHHIALDHVQQGRATYSIVDELHVWDNEKAMELFASVKKMLDERDAR